VGGWGEIGTIAFVSFLLKYSHRLHSFNNVSTIMI
jgi:hypothetical protein